jgi:tetratricopeptide (TPR) repeat protein
MFFSLWTYQRNSVWQSGSALWQDSVNKSPNKPRPHESLAYYLEQEGHLSEALRHYKMAVRLNPKNADSYNNIGNIYMKQGNMKDAILYYKTALPLQSSCKELCNNIGNALSKLGYLKQALTYYEIALKNDKNYTKAHINLANTLSVLGNTELAMRHYQLAAKLEPENIQNNYNRSILLLQKGYYKEASKILDKIVRSNASFKEVCNNLGVALENLGEIDKAKEKYQQALSIDPTFIDAQQNLSRIKNNNLPK